LRLIDRPREFASSIESAGEPRSVFFSSAYSGRARPRGLSTGLLGRDGRGPAPGWIGPSRTGRTIDRPTPAPSQHDLAQDGFRSGSSACLPEVSLSGDLRPRVRRSPRRRARPQRPPHHLWRIAGAYRNPTWTKFHEI